MLDAKLTELVTWPPPEHEFMRLHALECNGEKEVFRWDYGVWQDRSGIRWCPKSLAEMGWSYSAPYRHCGPTPPLEAKGALLLGGVKLNEARQDLDWSSVCAAAEFEVPSYFAKEDKEDIIQEVALEIMETKRSMDELKIVMRAVIKRHAKCYDAWKPNYWTIMNDE